MNIEKECEHVWELVDRPYALSFAADTYKCSLCGAYEYRPAPWLNKIVLGEAQGAT